MAKLCKDFTFLNKKISSFLADGKQKYIFVDFESEPEIALGLERDMEVGETNRYRTKANYFHDQWSDTLPLEFNIIKNPDAYETQYEMEFSKSDIREITRWLTSSHFPEWLKVESDDNTEENLRYDGYFNNIETWCLAGMVYGLKLFFSSTSPFAYTEDISDEITVSKYDYMLVQNDSDELFSYCYPRIDIEPTSNGEIFLCNLSDCITRENGTLELTGETYFNSLLDIIDKHAEMNGCTVEYSSSEDSAFNIVPICNETAIQFYLVDEYAERKKCTAFYLEDTKEYRIIEGGFMYMKVYKDLPVHIDCSKLIIIDDLGKMVTFDKLGVNDIDFMYWLRLINGSNSLLLFGDCKITITHNESRKVGE